MAIGPPNNELPDARRELDAGKSTLPGKDGLPITPDLKRRAACGL
jgi:hypothetical protein